MRELFFRIVFIIMNFVRYFIILMLESCYLVINLYFIDIFFFIKVMDSFGRMLICDLVSKF